MGAGLAARRGVGRRPGRRPAQPSIFIVGDRKQSIYRFRDAEVAVLQEAGALHRCAAARADARADRSRAASARSRSCSRSSTICSPRLAANARRARRLHYDEADRFPVEMRRDASADGPALGHRRRGRIPSVCATRWPRRSRASCARRPVRDKQTGVARARQAGRHRASSSARATSHREFEHALEAAGIPTYVYKGLGFFDADEIKDLSALIRFLANPSSDLRAAAFLRSRFVRLSDAALARARPATRRGAHRSGSRRPRWPRSTTTDRRALEQARRARARLARAGRSRPAGRSDRAAAARDGVRLRAARARGRQQAWENVKKMRGLIRRIQNRGYATLARIADHLDSLTAGDESNAVLEALDAVNLMTVHAAKGLEFPDRLRRQPREGSQRPPKPGPGLRRRRVGRAVRVRDATKRNGSASARRPSGSCTSRSPARATACILRRSSRTAS